MGGFVSRSQVRPQLKQISEYNDAVTKYRLLNERRQLIVDANRQRPLLRLMDKRWDYLGTVATEKAANWERLLDDSGTGTISLRWSDWLADLCAHKTRVQEDLHLAIDPNPNQRHWRTRLGFKVTDIRAVKHDDGTPHSGDRRHQSAGARQAHPAGRHTIQCTGVPAPQELGVDSEPSLQFGVHHVHQPG